MGDKSQQKPLPAVRWAQQAWDRSRSRWRRLPARRRSALVSFSVLALVWCGLLIYQWPRTSLSVESTRGALSAGAGTPAAGVQRADTPASLPAAPELPDLPQLPATTGADEGDPGPGPDGTTDPADAAGAAGAADAIGAADTSGTAGMAANQTPSAPTASDSPAGDLPPLELQLPLSGEPSPVRGFGWALFPETGDWRLHTGVDLPGEREQAVQAAAAGQVVAVREDPLLGTGVLVDHGDGQQSRYWGLGRVTVKAGQAVAAGDPLGYLADQPGPLEAGAGPHLHLELMVGDEFRDPMAYLQTEQSAP